MPTRAETRDSGAATPLLFRQGFRPFFLGAGLWSGVAIGLWLAALAGRIEIPTAFDPVAWHAHEMLFGYAGAVIAGFLLTAIPDWTGRLPLGGLPLAGLLALWFAGRIATATSEMTGAPLAALLDLAFLATLLAVVLREIVAGGNWRNLAMPVALGLLLLANALTHLETMGHTQTGALGLRLALAVIVLLICLIGGRVIPSFTRNWLVKRGEALLPRAFAGFDKVSLLVTLVALLAWTAFPDAILAGMALIVAGLANLVRMSRWRGGRTLSEPLVWSLHLGFLWVPIGLVLLGLAAVPLFELSPTAGLHALAAGAVGSMTLAVMTRASLGHSGRPLAADRPTTTVYALVALAAITRTAAPVAVDVFDVLLWTSGLSWIAAFILFTGHYGRILLLR